MHRLCMTVVIVWHLHLQRVYITTGVALFDVWLCTGSLLEKCHLSRIFQKIDVSEVCINAP